MSNHFGWVDNPDAVGQVVASLPMPFLMGNAPALQENKEVLLYKTFREVVGKDAPKGPQGIGDCVSWAWGNLDNYIQSIQIKLGQAFSYQETATEVIYALSRVEIGGQKGSYQDGSVGAWAAKAVSTMGTLSREHLATLGLSAPYDKDRAKKWGATGLPDSLEPEAYKHRIKTVSVVKTFAEAAANIQNGYPVAVCSNQGFSMTRDRDGFCRPQETWYHAMLFMAVRWDRPGLCCSQSWGVNTPDGPRALDQPDNTFWVDADTANRMLSQGDSFTGSQFDGYPSQNLIDWRF